MKFKKLQSALGLAMRAGKVVSGDSGAIEAIRKKEAYLVVLAKEASENTKKKFKDKCSHYQVQLWHELTQEQIAQSIGKETIIVIAITDKGFANLIRKHISEVENIES